ncbi:MULTISPECIES: tripartite tricarboxylate transporter substrate binding protein [Ramlibacter]|uniref:Tripartite tricarboxylate transporter substrate binding protein n=1 Tax=Ramlibacter pinisoli TaxID=2682844 RepID=A0A6N8IN12_9BURK|nr:MULTISPECIES: tripartite tricarboxylate transporter substrate binding protein [Ramlibacter]MBA2963264.1 tripartite tricarboxylate transporter substrate binding protein [Ramlibacter sp. CGMCC 1.13660]MVQ28231.1 tripartite tricarboxylate transporter substrate binding protein [Ramlibacter pinisoli]
MTAAWIARLGAGLVLGLASLAASAQATWPTKPIRIVVTFTPGGAPDTLARILADKWSSLGQTITVDNKPGAGGNIGADFVAKSPADGATLVVGTVGTHAINAALYPNMPYHPQKDFTPIAFLASTPNLLVVNNSVPARTVPELIALAKQQPLSFGSSGSGTSIHLSGELFNTLAGVKMQHIPYKGRAAAIPDLLGGRITMIFDNMPSALPLVKSGELRAIAVTSAQRSPAAPQIPTLAESGLPGFEATSWFALFAPANLPREVQLKINAETARVLAMPDVKEKLATLGLEPAPGTPEQLAGMVQTEMVKWAKVVKESGAKPD